MSKMLCLVVAFCAYVHAIIYPIGDPNTVTFATTQKYMPTTGDKYAGSTHTGVDIKIYSTEAVPIVAVDDGIVIFMNDPQPRPDGWGSIVELKHFKNDGTVFYTLYGHMVHGSILVKCGDYIRQGTKIGDMGSTGASTGPHLHFEVKKIEARGCGYLNGENCCTKNADGSISCAYTEADYYDPLTFIENNLGVSDIGHFSDGWHDDGMSQAILQCYLRNMDDGREIGFPFDNGGSKWIHDYIVNCRKFTPQKLYLQDFKNSDGIVKTICLLEGQKSAHLLEGCLGCSWWTFNDLLGAPTSDEFKNISNSIVISAVQYYTFGSMIWTDGSVKIKFNDEWCCYNRDNASCVSCITSTLSKKVTALAAQGINASLPDCSQYADKTQPYALYTFTLCKSVKDGTVPYSRIPENPSNTFIVGQDIHAVLELQNVSVKHRIRIDIFKDNVLYWSWGDGGWLNTANDVWAYSYAEPVQSVAPTGVYEFRAFIDIGSGYTDLGIATCTVIPEPVADEEYGEGIIDTTTKKFYTYVSSTICDSIGNGTGQWERVPIEPKTNFEAFDNVYCLVALRDISTKFRLKVDIIKDNTLYWTWGNGMFQDTLEELWSLGYAEVVQTEASSGKYDFIPSIDIGSGYTPLDTVSCTVSGSTDIISIDNCSKYASINFNGKNIYFYNPLSLSNICVSLFTVTGRLIYQNKLQVSQGSTLIDINSQKAKGVYQLIINAEGKKYIKSVFLSN